MTIDKLIEEKISRARFQVEGAKIDDHEKDSLLELLDHAESICNGGGSSLEANSKALGALLRAYVKDRVATAQKAATCIAELGGWRGMVLQAKWPLAVFGSVAMFSPNFPALIAFLDKIAK